MAFTLIFTLVLFSQLVGNPIMPVLISEIYFEEDEWTIELSDYYGFFGSLDDLWFVASSDTAQFKSGIFLYDNIPIIVNQDSMLTPLSINKNGDFLQVRQEYDGEWFDVCLPVYFGDYPDSWVNAPNEGQSLGRIFFSDPWGWGEDFFLVKNNTPSLGSNPYYVNTRGTFSGYVFDQQQNPIPNAQIHYFYYCDDIYTDQNGYFENNYMYGMNYNVTVYVDDIAMMDTLITIEPDSTTYCEFYINLYSVDEEQLQGSKIILSNYPNPFIESTTISFSAADLRGLTQIRIYNIKGQKIKTLECGESLSTKAPICRNYSISWDGKNESDVLQPPGFYFYSLEIDGKKVKTNKMIMVR